MPTKYAGTDVEQTALNAYITLLRCTETVTADTTRHLAGYKLTIGQFGVLEVLFHLGSLCQRDIGRKLLKSGGNITTVVDNLEKRGLVVRKRSVDDRRFYQVELTADGRELITAIMPRQVEGITRRMAALSADEQAILRQLCRKLGVGE
ncbi:MAG: MarR family transcriptional regulator [Desulfuromonas sp.]|nr:MAG: MarR family transcriptional regulator [Desulfuromonas sp.]